MKMFDTGNAESLATERGWFVGNFINPDEILRNTRDLEVKWGTHRKGDARPLWAVNREATTLSVLVLGKFALRFEGNEEIVLEKPGDYVLFGPKVPHHWQALEHATILTVRWPSVPGDSCDIPNPD